MDRLPLDGRPHVPQNIRQLLGDSRGRWEGNTLVIDITNTNAQTWFDQVGGFHSDALHIVKDAVDYMRSEPSADFSEAA